MSRSEYLDDRFNPNSKNSNLKIVLIQYKSKK